VQRAARGVSSVRRGLHGGWRGSGASGTPAPPHLPKVAAARGRRGGGVAAVHRARRGVCREALPRVEPLVSKK
jgi:hypothetical protein